MNMERIQAVIDLMREQDLCEFAIEEDGFKLSLKRAMGGTGGGTGNPAAAPAATPAPVVPAAAPAAPASPEENVEKITSPLVGTFYRAASPDSEPYVAVGSTVSRNTVVCVIEAMKVMNEIKAETSGVVRKILVENATAVQFGQPMFLIEKA